jgi:ribosomal protein S18 acetylase RimI-like enzyme
VGPGVSRRLTSSYFSVNCARPLECRALAIEPLSWDSEFFGVRIARARLSDTGLAEAIEAARREAVECLYLFVPITPLETVAEAVRAGARLVDLQTSVAGVIAVDGGKRPARLATAADLPELEVLAEKLAVASRFGNDPRFEAAAVAAMYRVWVRRSLDEGVVVVPDGELSGFVAARPSLGSATIELVYMKPEARQAGLARTLLTAAVHELGFERTQLVTHVGNIAGQRMCESLGLRTRSVEAVLHLWGPP